MRTLSAVLFFSLPLQLENALDVESLREHVDQMNFVHSIARRKQRHQIPRQRGWVAGDIGQVDWRQAHKRMPYAISEAATGRIYHHKVGLMSYIKGSLALPLPSRASLAFEILLR
jgi:hypothetical protein